jgi:hypothetical protein
MPTEKRELYSSTNGDRWFPVRDFATGSVFIRHEANIPSGGRVTEIDIGTFLGGDGQPDLAGDRALPVLEPASVVADDVGVGVDAGGLEIDES